MTEFCAISAEPTALAAICKAPTASVTISAEVTWFAPIFADVTEPVAKCIASILPVTNSLESTEFAAIAAESIELSATDVIADACNCAAAIALVAISDVPTEFSAISLEPTAFAAISLAVIELLTISVVPTALASNEVTNAFCLPINAILCLLQI